MKNSKLLILSTLVIVALAFALTACGAKPLTAEEAMKQSGEKMSDVKSFEATLLISAKASGMSFAIDGELRVKQPEQAYAKLSLLGQEIEIIVLSKEEIYIKEDANSDWQQVPADELSGMGGISAETATDLTQITDIAKNLKKEDDEKLDGVDCYVVSFEIDLPDLLAKVSPEAESLLGDTELQPVTGMIWVGKKDLLIRKINLITSVDSADITADLEMDFTFSNFNGDVEIPSPK